MSKRMKVFVSVLVAVVLLTVGGVATVMADGGSTATDNETGRNGLLARVAGILSIPEEDLIDAFGQARQEMREEAFIGYLDRAVEEGRITPEEAGEISEWRAQRPEVLDRGQFGCASGFPALRGHMFSGHRGWHRLGSSWLAD